MNANTCATTADEPDLPPVKTLLSALVWLASRQHDQPDARNLRAMLDQLRHLAMHPQADLDDLRAGLRLAARLKGDATLLSTTSAFATRAPGGDRRARTPVPRGGAAGRGCRDVCGGVATA